MNHLTRRELLGSVASGIALTSLTGLAGRSYAASAGKGFFERTQLPIGLQLYTVGEDFKRDLEGTLRTIAAIGFKTVELAGYQGHTPRQLRQAFDRAGLSCTSAHVPGRPFGPDVSLSSDLDRLAEEAHILGVATIVMPLFYIPDRFTLSPPADGKFPAWISALARQMTVADWIFNAEFLNEKGAALQRHGLQLAYHNHNLEFTPIQGATAYDILLRRTDPSLVKLEMDAGWVAAAGHDPVSLVKAHPGRFHLMHVKDIARATKPNFALEQLPANLGAGVINWEGLLPAAYRSGVREFFLEREAPFAVPPLEAIRTDFAYLHTLVA